MLKFNHFSKEERLTLEFALKKHLSESRTSISDCVRHSDPENEIEPYRRQAKIAEELLENLAIIKTGSHTKESNLNEQ